MKILMIANADRKVTLTSRFIGYANEKNIDQIKLSVSSDLPKMDWYLNVGQSMYPFADGQLSIDERLTSKKGDVTCRLIGTDAKPSQPIDRGKHLYKSDVFTLEVR